MGVKKDYFINAKHTFIKDHYGQNILDVGAGNCDFGLFLKHQGHQVKAIDVVNKCKHQDFDFRIFDGKNIPFHENEFDTSISFFVLHHTNNQEQLLKEMMRVTSKHIIIGEDIICNQLDRLLGKIHLNTAPWAKGDNSFRTNDGWLALFSKLHLSVVATEVIKRWEYPVYPVQRIIYVLAVK